MPKASGPSHSFSLIPLLNIDELNDIWNADTRLPTLASRRAWSLARNLEPQLVNQWFWRKRSIAKKRKNGIALTLDTYDLSIGNPPEIIVKFEPADKDSPRLTSVSSIDLSSTPCPSSPAPPSSSPSFFETIEPDSPRTSLLFSDDMHICVSEKPILVKPEDRDPVHHEEDYPPEEIPGGLYLPREYFQDHSRPTITTDEPDSYLLHKNAFQNSIPLPQISYNDDLSVLSRVRNSHISIDPACHSILSLDGKLFAPDGFQILSPESESNSSDLALGHIHLVQTTSANHFPILSELSPEMDYLPPLPTPHSYPSSSQSRLNLQDTRAHPDYLYDHLPTRSFIHHTWYRKHIDSTEYDAIVDVEFGVDTETIEYHAFVKNLITRWVGDDGWLMREQLYMPR